jgi:hypothetical protein
VTTATFPGLCRADLPTRHPLTPDEAIELTAVLAADRVPVTVQLARRERGPVQVILWPALALTTEQMAHTLRLVTARTDSPVRWAGVA